MSLEEAEKTKNWSGYLEGFEIVPPDVPVSKKDLAALRYFLLQTHYIAANDANEHLMLAKSSSIFRTVNATLQKERRWTAFVEQNKNNDKIGALAMGNAIKEFAH